MVVALIGVLSEWLRRPISGYDVAELAYRIERIDLGLAGGRQDQYAATFGGFNFIEFHSDSTVVNPLRIRRDTLQRARVPPAALLHGTDPPVGAHHRAADRALSRGLGRRRSRRSTASRRETLEMKKALLLGDVDAIGELLHQAWENKKRLDEGISNTPRRPPLPARARREGAIGGKMPGAGGGGYFLFLTRFDRKHRVAAGAREARRPGGAVPVRVPRAARPGRRRIGARAARRG